MTNKQLRDYLSKFPDDYTVYYYDEEFAEHYELKELYLCPPDHRKPTSPQESSYGRHWARYRNERDKWAKGLSVAGE